MATDPVIKMIPPWAPELLPDVVERVETFLKSVKNSIVLEIGSGWSTVWLASLSKRVVSLEHDVGWFNEVQRALGSAEYLAISMLVDPVEFPKVIGHFPNTMFDLIFIDCIDEQRLSCLELAIYKLTHGGMLVLDDTHWDMLKPGLRMMKELGWNCTVITGPHKRKSGETHYHQTTMWRKPRELQR